MQKVHLYCIGDFFINGVVLNYFHFETCMDFPIANSKYFICFFYLFNYDPKNNKKNMDVLQAMKISCRKFEFK